MRIAEFLGTSLRPSHETRILTIRRRSIDGHSLLRILLIEYMTKGNVLKNTKSNLEVKSVFKVHKGQIIQEKIDFEELRLLCAPSVTFERMLLFIAGGCCQVYFCEKNF